MAATPISGAQAIPYDIDFGSRVATLIKVGTIVNANLTYWAKAVTPAVVPAQSAANSPRRLTSQLNSLIGAVGGAYTAWAMSPPSAALVTYNNSDYHDFQLIMNSIIAQHNTIVTAHP